MTGGVALVGLGMTPFGRYPDRSLKDLGSEAVAQALADAGLGTDAIDIAFVANAVAGAVIGQLSVVGQSVLRAAGFSGIPVYNIDNACAGSASALNLAMHAIRAGAAKTALVLGVEKICSPDRGVSYRALNGAADVDFVATTDIDPSSESVFVKAVYPTRLARYATMHGLDSATLADIAVKNRAHAEHNPLAQYRTPVSAEEVLGSRTIVEPVTALMCAPLGDGAAAVVLTAADQVAASQRPVWVTGSAVGMAGDTPGESYVSRVARQAYAQAGIGAQDLDVLEVHDSIAFNELLAYEELGLCDPGGGARLVAERATVLGGRVPVNPSGGLESRGHPIAATGLAQIVELATQLRGEAGPRQVADARRALAESAGGFAGGDTAAVAITVLGAEPRR